MLKNYFKITFRNLAKNKTFSAINIFGLTIGLTAVILIALYIKFEYSFNHFNKNINDIYRVAVQSENRGVAGTETYVFVPPLGPAMYKDFPEVKNYVRFSTNRTAYFTYSNKSYKIEDITYADSSLFNVFSFNLLSGNPHTALVSPYSIVLTKTTAEKIFGNENPLGRIITINNLPYNITGVAENPPANSDIQFNSVISFSTLYRDPNNWMGWNGGNQYITYVQLKKNAAAAELNKKFPDFLWTYINKDLAGIKIKLSACLQPLNKIHLNYNEDSSSLKNNIKIYSLIALFILLIACMNFINLSTARSGSRAKEVGMRKTLGAKKKSLLLQFLSETIIISLAALIIALTLVEIMLPWFNQLIGKHLTAVNIGNPGFILLITGILVFTGIVAGLYPALYLSSYKPVEILKGHYTKGKQKQYLRRFLVVFQFVISIVLIISTFTINNQLNFMRDKKLGFDKQNIVVVPLVNDQLKSGYKVFKDELKQIPGVINAAASSDIPSNGFTSNGYFPEGFSSPLVINVVDVDDDFLKTFDIKIFNGRNFNNDLKTDKDAYIINQSLAEQLNWKDALNKTIRRGGIHKVIGIVKDFNYASLYYKIQPLIITNHPGRNEFDYVSIKLSGGSIPQAMNSIKNVWHKFAPSVPFEYNFLDQTFDQIYKADIKFREAFVVFSNLAIIIALLGLLGLASYTVELKRKEIGIRKVLGSSTRRIMVMLTKEYSKWILIANIIAWPSAFYIMNIWLQGFAYKVQMQLWIFILSGIIVFAAALLVIGFQVVKAASANPIESLRYE